MAKKIKDEEVLDMRNNFTQSQLEQLQDVVERVIKVGRNTPFQLNKNYLIRTATMIDIGRIKEIVGDFLVLDSASWIADTGRFHECLLGPGKFNEVEPFKEDVYISLASIIDATPWPYVLPRTTK